MPCHNCQRLCVRHRIDSASDLRKAIRTAFQNLEDGTLREAVSRAEGAVHTLQDLAFGAAWNERMSIGFACRTCGQAFRLTGQGRDGSGGSWEPG